MKKLLLIDGNALIHRAYHAFPKNLTSPRTKEKTGAIFGFTKILLTILKQIKPNFVACSFDLAAPTFRHKEYKEYKAKRVKAPQEMYDQIPRIKEVVKTLGIPIYEKENYEADDIIGTIAEKIKMTNQDAKLIKKIILTGDMDTLQLVNKDTTILTPGNSQKPAIEYDIEKVKEKYGFKPRQVIDFKALAGDPSDNIPGVVGIGETSAKKIIATFGSLDRLYKQCQDNRSKCEALLNEKAKLSNRQIQILLDNKNQAEFSKRLVTIRTDVPIDFDLEECKLNDYSRKRAERLFEEMGFKSLLTDLPEENSHRQGSLFN